MGEKTKAKKGFVGNPEGKRLFGNTRHRLVDYININVM